MSPIMQASALAVSALHEVTTSRGPLAPTAGRDVATIGARSNSWSNTRLKANGLTPPKGAVVLDRNSGRPGSPPPPTHSASCRAPRLQQLILPPIQPPTQPPTARPRCRELARCVRRLGSRPSSPRSEGRPRPRARRPSRLCGGRGRTLATRSLRARSAACRDFNLRGAPPKGTTKWRLGTGRPPDGEVRLASAPGASRLCPPGPLARGRATVRQRKACRASPATISAKGFPARLRWQGQAAPSHAQRVCCNRAVFGGLGRLMAFPSWRARWHHAAA